MALIDLARAAWQRLTGAKSRPVSGNGGRRLSRGLIGGLAALTALVAPSAALALSPGCAAINSMGGSFTVDSVGAGTDRFTDFATQPLANGETVNYSWSGNTKGAYVYILYSQFGGGQFAPESIQDATAVSGSGSFTFSNTSTGDFFEVGVNDDTLDNSISNPGARDSNVTITLSCSEPQPTVLINDVTLTEGNSGTKAFTFTISLSAAAAYTTNAGYATQAATATAVSDFVATSGTVVFAPGETAHTVTVQVKGDTAYEANEIFFLKLTSSMNALISDTEGVGTIMNDDALAAPVVSTSFTPTSITYPGSVLLRVNVTNPNGVPLTGVVLSGAALPPELRGEVGTLSQTCGTANLTAGFGNTLSYTAASIPGGATCQVSFNVSQSGPGVYNYTTGVPTAAGPSSLTGVAATTPTPLTVASPAPTVTAISPTAGPTSGGASVTITGTNLSGASAVTFGGTAATGFTVNSATSITATAPAGSAGTVDIRVTTPSGTSATSAADQYTFVTAPTVTSVSPTAGPTGGGNTVTITGTGFAAASGTGAVKFGATNATYTINSNTQITATAPANSVGTYDITVTTLGGTSATTAADQYTYISAPTVTSVSPTAGPTGGGQTVTITGTGFAAVPGAGAVKFGATNATYTINSNTQITATSPANSLGTYDITVTSPGGTSATTAADQYTYLNAPTVTAISPTAGPTSGGTTVTITGTGFGAAPGTGAVRFGATNATYTINSNTQITATSPANSAGTYDVTVTTQGGTSATSAADQFTYIAAPTVTSISPTAGPTAGGTSVTITGTNFTGVSAVTFGGTAATGFTFINATTITATAPAGSAGTVDIRVSTPGGTSATSAADQFTYVTAPTVTSVSPTAGPTGGGQTVTITGTGFAAAAGTGAVKFGATNATYTINSNTQITATSPANSAGTYDITVTTVGGTSATTAADQYTYVTAPTVTSVSPTAGPTSGGTTVTITGTGFAAAAGTGAVKFGATNAIYTINSNTQITATSPANSAGTYDITVTTLGGTSATSAADQFTYVARPTVTSISPNAGSAGGGNTVTITGTGFGAAAGTGAVRFGATNATYTIDSNTQITATAPAGGAGTIDITVTTVGGTSAMSAADRYIYIAAPTVTAISPTAGPTSGGATVVITGTRFAAASGTGAVKFGAIDATYTINSNTQITATAPANSAGTYDVTVTTSGGTSATSAADRYTYAEAPTATDPGAVVVAFNTATPIDLSGSISGSHSSIAVASGPSHGSTSISGDVVTYTPDANYAGTDSFTFTATGVGGTSAPATVSLTVSLGGQTITFPTLSDASLSASPLTLSATASSNLSVSFFSDTTTICTVSGTSLTLLQTGTCTIRAEQPGDTTWAAAPSVSSSFTVTPANLDMTTGPATGATVGAAYSQTNTGSGGVAPYSYALHAGAFPPGVTLDVSTGVVSGTPTVAGSFSYIVRVTDSQGAPVTTNGPVVTVTMAKGSQTLSFTSTAPSAVVGGPAYAVTATATSSLAAHFSLDGASTGCAIAGGSVTFTAPGTCVINANQAGDTNWNAAPQVQQSFAVVANPPIADNSPGWSVPYNSSGTPLDLSAWIRGGAHTSITVVTPPTHGVTSVAGDVVTYTPTAGYFGDDSFTYSATGPGGTSNTAFVNLTVGTPPPPAVTDPGGVAVGYNDAGAAIDLSASITGVHSSIAVATPPAHGAVTIAGDVVTYVPAADYYGADSFTFTATGPGGTSNAATVSLTVGVPPAPTVSGRSGVAVGYNSAGTAIDLSGAVTGVHSSIAVATPPAHGAVTVAGDVVTYVPTADYYGADSFTFTATGPGGTSNAATVSLTVGVPPAPTVSGRSGVAVGYNSAGTAIDLSGAVSGVHSSIAVATPPAHGAVTVAGDVITYVPTAGYFGPDSVTYTATGPGGTSSAAMVSLTVATPPPPVVDPPTTPVVVPTPPAGDGPPQPVAINLGSQSNGVIDGYRITATSQHGTAVITAAAALAQTASVGGPRAAPGAYQLVYTPAANFMGTDTVTVVGFGPGGDSAPATFTFRVAGKAPNLQGQTPSSGSVTFTPTAGLVGGPFQALRITRAPAFGTATVTGLTIVFNPGVANGGSTSLDYVIDLPFGASAAGRIDLVSNLVPGVQALTARTIQGRPVTVRVSDAPGGPFTGAAVVSISPTSAGTATIAGAGGTYDLTFTPTGTFSGQAVATFSLTNAFGTTNGTVTVMVEERPDPSQDPEVRGVATSQVTAARRFADAQIDNFQRRLQDLHDGDNGSSNGLSVNFGGSNDEDRDPRRALRRQLGQDRNLDPGALGDGRDREMLGLDLWADRAPEGAQAPSGAAGDRLNLAQPGAAGVGGPVGFWTAGSVDWGRQDAAGQRDSRFTTQGVTAGLDVRVSDNLIVGGGLGYGEDKTRIGDNGSVSRGEAVTGAVYASWRPVEAYYVDGVLGFADLNFDSHRWVEGLAGQPDGYADGERSGDVRFVSAAFGRITRGEGLVHDLYARLEARDIALDGFTETGGGLAALAWDGLEQQSLSANVGAAWRWNLESRRFGVLRPGVRVEWSHEFEDIGSQGVRYADWAASPTYLVPLDAWSRNALNLNLETEWSPSDRLTFSGGYRGLFGDQSTSHGAEIRMKYGW